MTKYRIRQPTVEAIWVGGFTKLVLKQVEKLSGKKPFIPFDESMMYVYHGDGNVIFVRRGQWLVKDEEDRFTVMSPEMFGRTYEVSPEN